MDPAATYVGPEPPTPSPSLEMGIFIYFNHITFNNDNTLNSF